MRIEELIIEGFKSYAVRTHITGWDPEFNAITGLNGTGKSNVLDAICFVLGMTKLGQLRANNMQDLIYKRGQAGITKASVTIIFNNEDHSKSPVGFEQFKQITVTRQVIMSGQSKYLVNGHKAQQKDVTTLFQSVQLSIDNPHFLIMQGKITKVLNMKPPEILAMIEEAAGTRMFEDRKEKALKTIAKKEKKVEEITTLLHEEIEPKLEKLRTEKRSYLEFQKISTEIERLNHLIFAYEYKKHEEKLRKTDADFGAKKDRIEGLRASSNQLKVEIDYLQSNIEQTTAKKEKELGNGKYNALGERVKELSNEVVRINTKCDLKKASIDKELQNKQSLISNRNEMTQGFAKKKSEYEKLQNKFEQIKKSHDAKQEQVRKEEELLQTLTTGIFVFNFLIEAKSIATQALTATEQAKIQVTHIKKKLSELEPLAKAAQRDNKGLTNELETARKIVNELKESLDGLNWDLSIEADLLKRKSEKQAIIRQLSENLDSLTSQLGGLEFTYTDPSPSFDRSKVKGLIAELIKLDKDKETYSTALEICAGDRLYNVVVENEVVATQLFERGKLRRRFTLLPLNKIRPYVLAAAKISAAKKLAPGKVDLALSLINADREVALAMEHAFGSTFICADAETAKKLTFGNVKARSVTLDGDVYDPSGILQGGSKPTSSGLLIKMQRLRVIKLEINEHKRDLDKINAELQAAQKTIAKYNELKKKLDLKIHEAGLLEERLRNSSNSKVINQTHELRQQLIDQEKLIVASNDKRKDALETCKKIEAEMDEFHNNRESKLKEIEKRVAKGKSELASENQRVKNMQQEVQTLQLEMEQTEEEIQGIDKEIQTSDETIRKLTEDKNTLKDELSDIQELLSNSQKELQKESEMIFAFDEEIKELRAAIEAKNAQVTDIQLELSSILHEVERSQKEKRDAEKAIKKMEDDIEWISQKKHLFGEPNTPYDFTTINMNEAKPTLRQLEERYATMRKKVNAKVMNMIESVEKKEASLQNMLAQVKKDKKSIEDTIVQLDNYKKDALEKTWRKVNGEFGPIFNELLPNSFAKLQPLEGKQLTDGLEVKVCLGGVQKKSLTELSGGQRSLIALSLILSLLQFKPAPMYILDEIDAALDLSHTQNIGQLLKSRFKGSQFIVVSLKDGMFNNANVLFRTKFRDGTSYIG
ncbi:9726_t:CDS:10 [Paraglomus occultum]|uniref:9726_t:CDS:1 n=1 Tax=Paraglomus occultum TaxID=144539 RepID=A0A9N9BZX7_9GLOM|nr:9726_t:CDS:10 [Paraglomus occultum]